MSTNLPRTGIALLGTILLFAVLTAGCASSPYGQAPTTTTVTTAPATSPPTTEATTVATTATTIPPTTTTAVPTTAAPISVTVTIENYAFIPASVTVPAGSTVYWTNLDPAAHQILSDTHAFMGNPMSRNTSYSFTFNTQGTFPYHCAIHPSMKGTITVT